MNKVRTEKIKDNITLHTLKDNKFKTNLINFYFKRPLIEKEVTFNALLPMVLQRGTRLYPTSKSISKKLEDLYGTYLSGDVTKKGEIQIIRFSISFADSTYIEEENISIDGLKLINDILTDPFLDSQVFKESYVKQEKDNLANRIKGRINDKMKYAVDRCAEIMCENENYKLYEYGNIFDLESITANNLYDHYKNIIGTSPLDIIAVGNIDHNNIKEIIKNILKLNIDETISFQNEIIEIIPDKVKEVTENMDVNQGKLTLGYRTNISYQNSLYPALMVYSSILGGGAHSKLFIKVREEHSLCYYIFSRVDKFKSLLFISSGIEINNYETTKDIIEKQLIEMKEGNISQQEIDYAKKSIITSIKELGDSQYDMADYIYSQIIGNNIEPLENMIKKINEVTIDEIIKVAQKIKLDTIYFITNN